MTSERTEQLKLELDQATDDQPSKKHPGKLMNATRAAKYLGISQTRLHRLKEAKMITCYQPSGPRTQILYGKNDLDAFLEKCTVPNVEPAPEIKPLLKPSKPKVASKAPFIEPDLTEVFPASSTSGYTHHEAPTKLDPAKLDGLKVKFAGSFEPMPLKHAAYLEGFNDAKALAVKMVSKYIDLTGSMRNNDQLVFILTVIANDLETNLVAKE